MSAPGRTPVASEGVGTDSRTTSPPVPPPPPPPPVPPPPPLVPPPPPPPDVPPPEVVVSSMTGGWTGRPWVGVWVGGVVVPPVALFGSVEGVLGVCGAGHPPMIQTDNNPQSSRAEMSGLMSMREDISDFLRRSG